MKPSRLFLALGLLATGLALRGAEAAAPAPAEPTERKSSLKETVKARMIEDAKKAPPASPAKPTSDAAKPAADPAPAMAAKADAPAPAGAKGSNVLPQVEVRRDRITVLDVKIQEQEKAIALEKESAKATEVDRALNDAKVSKALSFLGGESAAYREQVARERVSLMESERDILEAMKSARTKEEKAELQKQLDELRAMRRDLEKAMR